MDNECSTRKFIQTFRKAEIYIMIKQLIDMYNIKFLGDLIKTKEKKVRQFLNLMSDKKTNFMIAIIPQLIISF